ncbi:MAG TPA: 50S ribosomal protein L29 [Candidatus Sulfotelmatobacter sp.]|nr:50S ribosomal protein L29 [Candidatus Sulfotelmatobacter sp.]
MTAADLRDLSPEELAKKEAELREDLFKLRMRAAVSQLENPSRIRKLRRDIARIHTVRRERDLAAGRVAAPEAGRAQ